MLGRLIGVRVRTGTAAGEGPVTIDNELLDAAGTSSGPTRQSDGDPNIEDIEEFPSNADVSAHGADADQPAYPQADADQGDPGLRPALLAATIIFVAMCGLIGYLFLQTHHAHVAAAQRELFLQTGRQAAIDLTTISYQHADADVARILDSATGTFHDDFQKRAEPFVAIVKKVQTTTQGSVTAAGVESIDGNRASVIVAVSVQTSNAGVPAQQPRGWRMRLAVEKVGDTAKVSDVQFVP